MQDRTSRESQAKHVSPSAAAFVGGDYLPSIKAQRLGNQIRAYKNHWRRLEEDGEYDRLPELYRQAAEAKLQLEKIIETIEVTREAVDADYGSD